MTNPATEFAAPFADLLSRAGLDAGLVRVTPCAAGGNNRIYRAETTAGVFAVKQYFRNAGDLRDRLAAEYAFLSYASVAAPGITPRPYAFNPDSGMALYEFVAGERIGPGEVGAAEVQAAARFFQALNSLQRPAASGLPVASEACFSFAEHLALIGRRIDRLLEAGAAPGSGPKALALFRRLHAKWRQVSAQIRTAAGNAGLEIESELQPGQRCISPSDFGFHNALREVGGGIRFLDFEYAGWDDPAKTAGDFFAQLAVPVPPEYFGTFVGQIMAGLPDREGLALRARLLRPAYQIKWCCIALNVFLPVHLARRKFADPGLDVDALMRAQLVKADNILNSMDTTDHGLH